MEELFRQLIEAVGEDSEREGLRDTPARAARFAPSTVAVWVNTSHPRRCAPSTIVRSVSSRMSAIAGAVP